MMNDVLVPLLALFEAAIVVFAIERYYVPAIIKETAVTPSMAFMSFPSKESLIKALRELKDAEPGLLHLVGYAGDDGKWHALSAEDLR